MPHSVVDSLTAWYWSWKGSLTLQIGMNDRLGIINDRLGTNDGMGMNDWMGMNDRLGTNDRMGPSQKF